MVGNLPRRVVRTKSPIPLANTSLSIDTAQRPRIRRPIRHFSSFEERSGFDLPRHVPPGVSVNGEVSELLSPLFVVSSGKRPPTWLAPSAPFAHPRLTGRWRSLPLQP